jgi:SAM-dependent methyltransferase
MPGIPEYLAPLTGDLLRLAVRGLALPARPRVLDLCCGHGSASRLLATEFEAVCTGVDLSESLLRIARERALDAGLQDRLEFLCADARHLEFPNGSFDLVLGLGGTLSYIGRPEGLERIRQLLKPGGSLLLSDLVYLESPAPEAVVRVLRESLPGDPVRGLQLEPAVRGVFEEGIYRFENERSYRELLLSMGYEVRFAFLVPESGWDAYYGAIAEGIESLEGEVRIPVGPEELASYYCWGGRWGLGYLVCGAGIPVEGT